MNKNSLILWGLITLSPALSSCIGMEGLLLSGLLSGSDENSPIHLPRASSTDTFVITPNGVKITLVRDSNLVSRVDVENVSGGSRDVKFEAGEPYYHGIYVDPASSCLQIYSNGEVSSFLSGAKCSIDLIREESSMDGASVPVSIFVYKDYDPYTSGDIYCSRNLFPTNTFLPYVESSNDNQSIPEGQSPVSFEDMALWRTFSTSCKTQ